LRGRSKAHGAVCSTAMRSDVTAKMSNAHEPLQTTNNADGAFAPSCVMPVAVLFARADSIYKTLPGCDVYDAERDALTWQGGCPAVAHPPCRLWGRLRGCSTAPESEKGLALWAVEKVRQWGGVLEHPAHSLLWTAAGLPVPGKRDVRGGFTLAVSQFWWGHKADKLTWLYVCGIEPAGLPSIPYRIGEPEYVVTQTHGQSKRQGNVRRPEITKAEREHTPVELACWLVELARRTGRA
jgi:hypothetical protein